MGLNALTQAERLELCLFDRRYLVHLETPTKTFYFSDRNYVYQYDNPDAQDYDTDYTEVDVVADRITLSDDTITVTTLDNNEEVYVYKDFGANYFNHDFEFRFKFKRTAIAGGDARIYLWGLANEVNDLYQLAVTDLRDVLSVSMNNAGLVTLQEANGGSWQADTAGTIATGTTYYATVKRVEAEGTYGKLYLYLYTDAARTVELAGSPAVIDLSERQDFRYLYAMSAYKNVMAGMAWSGEIKNLAIVTPQIQQYENYLFDLSSLAVDLARLQGGRNHKLTLRFRNDVWGGEVLGVVYRLIDWTGTHRFCFATVKTYELRLVASDETFGSDVKQLMYRGVCGQPYDITRREFKADCSNVLLAKRDRLPLQVVDTAVDADADPDDLGKIRNSVYGTVEQVPCLAVAAGAMDTLTADISAAAVTITVSGNSKIAFPAAGTIQIDDEKITYTGFVANQFTGCTRGTGGTTAVAHNKGAGVFEVLSEYIYEIAKHPVKAIDNVYVDAVRQTAGFTAYTGQTGDELAGYDDRAVIKFTVKPIVKKQINITVPAADYGVDEGSHDHATTEEIVVWWFDMAVESVADVYSPEVLVDKNLATAATLTGANSEATVSKEFYQEYQGTPTEMRLCMTMGANQLGVEFHFHFCGLTLTTTAENTTVKTAWTALGASYDTWAEINAADGLVQHIDAGGLSDKVAEVWAEIKYTPDITAHAATGVDVTGSSTPVGNSSADTVIGQLVTADVDGYQDDGAGTYTGTPDALIERPDHVLKHILVALLGEAAGDIGASFATSGASYGATYKLGFILHEVAQEADRLLQELAFQCRSKFLEWHGKFELIYMGNAPAVIKTFTDDDTLEEPVFGYTPEIDIRNRIYGKYKRDYRKSGPDAYDGVESASHGGSITANGERPESIELSACRTQAMAANWVAWYLVQVRTEWRTLEIVAPWIGKTIDPGETFGLTWDFFTGLTWDLVEADIDSMHEQIRLIGQQWPS